MNAPQMRPSGKPGKQDRFNAGWWNQDKLREKMAASVPAWARPKAIPGYRVSECRAAIVVLMADGAERNALEVAAATGFSENTVREVMRTMPEMARHKVNRRMNWRLA